MALRRLFNAARPLPGAPHVYELPVAADLWRSAALDLAAGGARLVALWASNDRMSGAIVYAGIAAEPELLVLTLTVSTTDAGYPRLDDIFPAADRMQRAAADMCGIRARDADTRPWLRHAAWPADHFPLVGAAQPARPTELAVDGYSFVRVEGDGVHMPSGCRASSSERGSYPSG